MLRYMLAFVLYLHGLIHLMGFAKAFNYAQINQLTQPISKAAGALWGLTALFFTVATLLFLMKKDVWWIWALPAVLLSQTLIFSNWQDAKFGTIANLIIAFGVVLGFANWDFKKMVNAELQSLFTQTTLPATVSKEKMAALPPIVQTWLQRSGVHDKIAISNIQLQQQGQMRTTPDGAWMPVEAKQFFTIHPPAFIWLADVQMLPWLHLAGRDKYMAGKGHMLIKAGSLFPIANAKGAETDQGSLLRFLGEMVWFPSAALSAYITWEALDASSAKATMNYGGVEASGIFSFKENGDFGSFEADRFYERKSSATLERWRIEAKAWKRMGDMRVPVDFEVTWRLKEGDFTWFKLQVTDIQYNVTW